MSGLWERFKRWFGGDDIFDVYRKEQERKWREHSTTETVERHRALLEQAAEIARANARVALRDEFAKAALTGMHARDGYDDGLSTPEKRANLAYIDADAMMKARERVKE
jgi:hypothetical protein